MVVVVMVGAQARGVRARLQPSDVSVSGQSVRAQPLPKRRRVERIADRATPQVGSHRAGQPLPPQHQRALRRALDVPRGQDLVGPYARRGLLERLARLSRERHLARVFLELRPLDHLEKMR